jgi:hypothetical protein
LPLGDEVGKADDRGCRRCRHGGLERKYLQNWSNELTIASVKALWGSFW